MNKFAQGYQEALQDVLNIWRESGPDAAMAYIQANLRGGKE